MAVLKDLIVHGRSRFVNEAQFNTINAESIKASKGIFNKLIATTATIDDLTAQNATVVGLLDVQGQLHSNSWTNSNIATIDGSFFITPTVSVAVGAFTYNGSQITLSAGSGYSFGIDAGDWVNDSLVMITGQVAGTDSMLPLGTIRGKLVSAEAEEIVVVGPFTDSEGNNCVTLTEIGQVSGRNAKNLKVSLYQKKLSSGLAPLGIYMTSGGMNTQNKSFIDIYNGGNILTTAPNGSGAFAKPVVRIGNLANLGSTGGQPITGYGIYTTNGYFEGVIVSSAGKIANWNITDSSIQTGNWNTPGTMYFGSSGLSLGTTFRVTNAGELYATSGTIGGYSLTANYLQSTDGTTGISVADNSATASWAFWAGGTTTSTVKFRVDHNGILNATGAVLKTLTINDDNGVQRVTVDASNGFAIYQNFQIPNETTNPVTYETRNLKVCEFNNNIILYRPGTETPAITINNDGTAYLSDIYFQAGGVSIAKASGDGFIIYDGTGGVTNDNIVARLGRSILLGQKNITTQIAINSDFMSFTDPKQKRLFQINTTGGYVTDYISNDFNISLENYNSNNRTGSTPVNLTSQTNVTKVVVNGPINVRFDDPYDSIVSYGSCYAMNGGDGNRIVSFYPDSNKGSWNVSSSYSFNAVVRKTYSLSIFSYTVDATIQITLNKGGSNTAPYLTWNLIFNPDNSIKNKTCYGGYTHLKVSGTITYEINERGPYYSIGSRVTTTNIAPGGLSTILGQQLESNVSAQTVVGKYNVPVDGAFIIGNGTGSGSNRSNALVVDWSGNLTITGSLVGKIVTNSTTLPQFSGAPSYLVGIEAFADGGQMKWQSASSVNVGYATSAGSASSATTCTYPAGFVSRNDNATWGNTTGTTITCWNEVNGGSIDFRRDNPSSGKMSVKVDGRFYYNEGSTPVWGLTSANGYWGMTDPDGSTASNCWIRTTQAGIIPYQSGGAGSGHQYLGTASWYFSATYVDNIYAVNGTYSGNVMAQGMAGQIIMFGGATSKIPLGWLPCDGSSVLIADYPLLAAALYDGSTYVWGQVDSTHFNLPDLRGRAPIGAGTGSGLTARTLGATVGEENHTLSAAESGLPAHTHSFTQPDVKYDVVYRQTASSGGGVRNCTAGGKSSFSLSGGAVGAVTGGAKSASSAHNNMQPSTVVNFIICTGQIN